MSRRGLIWAAGPAILLLAIVALVNPVGRMILQSPTAGGACDLPASAADFAATRETLDFTSPFNSDNRMANGSMIRSARDAATPDCRRIGNSYRCLQQGPAIVEIRTDRMVDYYGVPDGSVAVIFGGPREAFCVLDPPEDER